MDRVEIFKYLDRLRESGRTNMWGAAAYLEAECGLDRKDAKRLTVDWMKTFSRDIPVEDRATEHK